MENKETSGDALVTGAGEQQELPGGNTELPLSWGRGSLPALLTKSTTAQQERPERNARRGRGDTTGASGEHRGQKTLSTAEGEKAGTGRGTTGCSWKGREANGENKAARSLVYWLITHTASMYTNINIPMYTFTWDSQVTPRPLPHPRLRFRRRPAGAGTRR